MVYKGLISKLKILKFFLFFTTINNGTNPTIANKENLRTLNNSKRDINWSIVTPFVSEILNKKLIPTQWDGFIYSLKDSHIPSTAAISTL